MITGSQMTQRHRLQRDPERGLHLGVAPLLPARATSSPTAASPAGPALRRWLRNSRPSTLNIVGVGTHWLQGETTLSFGPGVNIDALTINSPTTAQVQITVLSTAPGRLRDTHRLHRWRSGNRCSRPSTSKKARRSCWPSRPAPGSRELPRPSRCSAASPTGQSHDHDQCRLQSGHHGQFEST